MRTPVEITEEQIDQYQRDGAILLKGFLTDEEKALLEEGMEQSRNKPGKRSSTASDQEGKGETFMESFSILGSPALKQMLDTGRIPEVAAKMMRAPSSQLILDQIFYKAKGRIIPTPWHQDTPYLRVRGDDMIRVWITPDYSPKELTLKIIRGSHRWNVIYNPRLAGNDNNSLKKTGDGKIIQLSETLENGPVVPDIERYPGSFEILTWDVEPGDALIFNGNMLHAAGGTDDHPTARRAYTTMWAGPELQYISPPDNAIPTLAAINHIEVPHGSRVGDYKNAFPAGWEQ